MATLKLSDFSVVPDNKKQKDGGWQKKCVFAVRMLMYLILMFFLHIFGKLVPQSIAYSRASESEWTFPCSNSKMNFDDESLAGTFGVSSTST